MFDKVLEDLSRLAFSTMDMTRIQLFTAVASLFLSCLEMKRKLGMEISEEEKKTVQLVTDVVRRLLETRFGSGEGGG